MGDTIKRLIGLGSFRGQLMLWFGGLTLATLVSVGFYIGQIATRDLAASGGETLYLTAKSAADLLGSNMRERSQEVLLLSMAPHLKRGDLAGQDVRDSFEQRKKLHGGYAWLGVTDPAGRVLQASGGLLVNGSVADRSWFVQALKGPFIGDTHEAVLLAKLLPKAASETGSNQPLRLVDFAAPVFDDQGALRGVLGTHVLWSWVTETVRPALSNEAAVRGLEVLILNRAGGVLYPEAQSGTVQLLANPPGAAHYQTVRWDDGQDYLVSHVAVNTANVLNAANAGNPGSDGDLGWRVVVRQPLAAALAPIQALRNRLLLLGLLAAAVFALLTYRFAARVSRPIEQLAHAVRGAQGNSAVNFSQSGHTKEIGQLTDSIESMTTSLREKDAELHAMNASLEATIAERGAALTLVNRELELLATHDSLTGLHNRRRFDEKLLELFLMRKRSGRNFSLLIIDADHFKRVNDNHGHPTGDEVLKQLAQVLLAGIRGTDFVARYGGEEFAVLLPDTRSEQDGWIVAEKIRMTVATTTFFVVGQVTISIGMSCSGDTDFAEAEIVRRADRALYQAKALGRNRTEQLLPSSA